MSQPPENSPEGYVPYVPPPPSVPPREVADLDWLAPWQWLALGWQDLRAHPGIGLFYGAVGGVFAALAIASIEVVFKNTGVMLLWGALVTLLTVGALLLPWAAGLLVIGPLLGHASWHAYRQSVCWPMPTAALSPSAEHQPHPL
ncbi:MAG: hypothetical protein NTU86_14155 [Burkholderiales bacterium]|nr:hypothetical protein [Burkholderiales bacterium]